MNSFQVAFTEKEWFHEDSNRLNMWKNYLFQNIHASRNIQHWFYWVAYFIEPLLQITSESIDKVITNDVRYRDQLQQMCVYVQDILSQCRYVKTTHQMLVYNNCPCRYYQDQFWYDCSPWNQHKVNSICMCTAAKNRIMKDVMEILHDLLTEWVSQFYYVRKLYEKKRIHFPVRIHIYTTMPLDNIRLWEVVSEDEEKQILVHPLLSHPSDFLERQSVNTTSHRYIDKARFEYQIPDTLSRYPVVFTKTASMIPKMIQSTFNPQEQVICDWKQSTLQIYYQESTSQCRDRHAKKKHLSKILKETRNKKKTQWIRRRRRKNELRQFVSVDNSHDCIYEDCSLDVDSYYKYDNYEWYNGW